MRSIVWFRRDLRILDNPALYRACQASESGVIGLFLLTAKQWLEHDDSPHKVKFWLDNLQELSIALRTLNIPLIVKSIDRFELATETVLDVATQNECSSVYFNREYEVNERDRDRQVEKRCVEYGVACHSFHDRVIVPPGEITTKDGRFYSVYTPFRKNWESKASAFLELCPSPQKQPKQSILPSQIPNRVTGFDFAECRPDLWPAGELEANHRMERFGESIGQYHDFRDLPAVNGTSLLSPYLAAGVVSPRQCLNVALKANQFKMRGEQGPTTWISELIWRDFYTHVLVGFPQVSRHQPFKLATDSIPWRDDPNDFQAWKQGQTGYPIVDAGMRQLNQTGWMHNRLRMVTAMFLSKHLMIDWRMGERYFMQQLIDGDLAANNGGWQWSASTGTDAVPYFRIFNPFSQSKRFDSEGKFIKKFCPELTDVPNKALHDAAKLELALSKLSTAYPEFIVDHQQARERVLRAFKAR